MAPLWLPERALEADVTGDTVSARFVLHWCARACLLQALCRLKTTRWPIMHFPRPRTHAKSCAYCICTRRPMLALTTPLRRGRQSGACVLRPLAPHPTTIAHSAYSDLKIEPWYTDIAHSHTCGSRDSKGEESLTNSLIGSEGATGKRQAPYDVWDPSGERFQRTCLISHTIRSGAAQSMQLAAVMREGGAWWISRKRCDGFWCAERLGPTIISTRPPTPHPPLTSLTSVTRSFAVPSPELRLLFFAHLLKEFRHGVGAQVTAYTSEKFMAKEREDIGSIGLNKKRKNQGDVCHPLFDFFEIEEPMLSYTDYSN